MAIKHIINIKFLIFLKIIIIKLLNTHTHLYIIIHIFKITKSELFTKEIEQKVKTFFKKKNISNQLHS